MILLPEMQTVPPVSYQEMISIVLTALAVILTALGVLLAVLAIGLTVLAFMGYSGLKEFVRGLADAKLAELAEQGFKEQMQKQMVARSADAEEILTEETETEATGTISRMYPEDEPTDAHNPKH